MCFTISIEGLAKMTMPMKLPPGPKGKWRPTLAIIKDPRAAFEKWKAEYGDPFFVMHSTVQLS